MRDYKDIELEYKDVDTDVLHAQIKAELGDLFLGMSTTDDKIILHVAPDAKGSHISKAMLKYAEHDVSKLPPKPVVKSDQERIAELEAAVAELLATKNAK